MLNGHLKRVDRIKRHGPHSLVLQGISGGFGAALLPVDLVAVEVAAGRDAGLGRRGCAGHVEGEDAAAWRAVGVEVGDGPLWEDEIVKAGWIGGLSAVLGWQAHGSAEEAAYDEEEGVHFGGC